MEKQNQNISKTDGGGGVGEVKMKSYCVTGATGYIGSWLVKCLLERGCRVHAAVRHPERCGHLLALWGGSDRLQMFKADLDQEGSFDEAVEGCDGVFHVAASMEFTVPPVDDLENYVQSNIINPAIKGTLNLLKSCLKSKSIKRVVFTSSISTMTAKDRQGEWLPIVDESCQTPLDIVWSRKTSGWVYVLSKRLTEEAAFQFAKENRIHLVSVITTTVSGPFITSTIPSSIRVLLSPITGDPELFPILSAVNSRMGSIALVHIEDICRAHIYLMEHDRAEGRYICCTQSCTMSELVHHLAKEYPSPDLQRFAKAEHTTVPTEISSKKLRDLGFTYNYSMQDIIHQTVDFCIEYGFLPPIGKQ